MRLTQSGGGVDVFEGLGCGDRKLELSATLACGFKRRGTAAPLVVDGDDGFDGSEFGVGEFIEFGGDFFDVEAVGDPDLGVDVSSFDNFDDFAEVGGEGVSRSEEGLLTAVEDGGVGEGEFESCDADVDDPGGESAEIEAGGH